MIAREGKKEKEGGRGRRKEEGGRGRRKRWVGEGKLSRKKEDRGRERGR